MPGLQEGKMVAQMFISATPHPPPMSSFRFLSGILLPPFFHGNLQLAHVRKEKD